VLGPAVPAHSAGYVIAQAQGFDSCTRPTASQMSTWWANSPYYVYYNYIGGSSYNSNCSAPSGSWIDTVTSSASQAWNLVFTWVGPQAPASCTSRSFSTYMSLNTTTAYNQGTSEGASAYNKLVNLGVSTLNAPVAYDIEGYNGGASCRAAVKSLMKGWADQLALAPAQKSGSYGSSCSAYIDDFASDGNSPDFIWGADWGNSKNTTSISCVSDTHWTNHQRHEQWKGGHSETWGGVTLSIDSDCANGPTYGTHSPNDGLCS
jgi:hypothetical protein